MQAPVGPTSVSSTQSHLASTRLADIEQYDGVTGHMVFDPNQKNVAPMYLGTVGNGTITYRVATMEKPPAVGPAPSARRADLPEQIAPYARVGEDGVAYAGPHLADVPPGPVTSWCSGQEAAEYCDRLRYRTRSEPSSARIDWDLVAVDSDQNWGARLQPNSRTSFDEHALAMIALDRNSAHLAEQLALKALVPVIALSADRALTATNVPWIFRMPGEATPASALRLLRLAASNRAGRIRSVCGMSLPQEVRWTESRSFLRRAQGRIEEPIYGVG